VKPFQYDKRCFLIVLSAPSGGGKSTICKEVLDRLENVEYSISYTTRSKRGGETDGKDYFFVSEERFQELLNEGDFLEYAKVHNNWYATSKSQVLERIERQRHTIMDIDVQGAQSIIEGGIDAVTIFLIPPNLKTLEERLRRRSTDTEETIKLRLNNARREVEKMNDYQYLVINDDLETAVNDVVNIIKAEENRVTRYLAPEKIFYKGVNNE